MVMKLTALAALLAALIASANATTYTTVVTTTVADEMNPRGQQECSSELQHRRFENCMKYMQSAAGGQYEPFLRSAVANPSYGEQELNQCCRELRSVKPQCRCEALKKMMRQTQGLGREMEEMSQVVEMLPQRCQIEMPGECRISGGYF